jgi:7,8-dihydropterin-6-yl-methyl-4-(beta-D-ribofuranosyl)aminobenzene 5'-phosphate synthase
MPSHPESASPELDELTITIVVDNATDTLSSIAPVATARLGERTATVLFDVGPYGDVWLNNAERLAVDLADIEVLFLSHWHWDHSGGIPSVVAAIAAARSEAGRTPLVVDVHPDRPDQRGILTPLEIIAMLPPEPTLEAIEAAGGRVETHADVHAVSSLFLASGEIPRRTAYETGLAGHHTWHGDQVALDMEIHDERFLAARVRGRGTTVLTACSHAGVVNVGLEARRLSPTKPSTFFSAGEPPPPSPPRSARPAGRQASSARATCSPRRCDEDRPAQGALRGHRPIESRSLIGLTDTD